MNAITQTATQAIATLETAAPAQNLILVPLSQLRPSRRNVRKTAGQSIDALAASIARVGLLQNLTVILASDGEHYEVVAGGRRLVALKLLAKKRRIPKDWDVPCLLVADGSARTVSLTENVQREAMHPADQFEAFAALVAEGRPIEDIAADLSVTPLVVQRRLKLANVSPRLMADYRADAVTLDQLMALAITDDHSAQEAAFYDAPTWQRSPSALRERLTEREIDAHRHPLVRFVGLDAYEQAGGGSGDQMYQDAQERWKHTLDGLHTAMRMQAQVSQNLREDESALADLVSQSQSAQGALQAMQATNQLLALQAKQSIQAQQLQITQERAAALELARQAAAIERGREVTRRFLGDGTPYTPQRVDFYGN